MAGSTFFTSATMQRQSCSAAFPQLTGLTYNNLPLGIVKNHSLEITVNRRYAARPQRQRWRSRRTDDGEPDGGSLRSCADAVADRAERPAVPLQRRRGVRAAVRRRTSRSSRTAGVLAKIFGGWQTGGTFEYQPGALLDWGNLFFNGDLDDIAKSNPEIALQRDGTLDPTKTWFNTEAGFEK